MDRCHAPDLQLMTDRDDEELFKREQERHNYLQAETHKTVHMITEGLSP